MNFNSHLENASSGTSSPRIGLTQEDIAALSHYPTIEKMFEHNNLNDGDSIKNKLSATFQNLERVILRGSKDDANRAQTAATGIRVALNFIEELERIKAERTA